MAQGAKSIIFNNSFKIYCVKCPWFCFWLVFVPYATWAVFCSIDETVDVRLPPWFAINIMWSIVCPICNMTACKLMQESAIMGLPSHYSVCPSQLKYQMKKFWLKASVLYKLLLSSVPYTTLHLIHNSMFIFFVYWIIHQLLWSKTDIFVLNLISFSL